MDSCMVLDSDHYYQWKKVNCGRPLSGGSVESDQAPTHHFICQTRAREPSRTTTPRITTPKAVQRMLMSNSTVEQPETTTQWTTTTQSTGNSITEAEETEGSASEMDGL